MKQNISYQKLHRSFYLDDTVNVAKKLIGKLLVRKIDGETLSAIICETEAYTGFSDKACHSYKGKSDRTKVMFEEGGKAYVYLIYGMYSCFNITTREEGVPEAVLIRAACPVEGIERMKELRQSKKQIKSLNEKNLLSGPGRLCDAMGITREQNGILLTGDELFICEGISVLEKQIAATKRINIDYAEEARDFLYRFVDTKSACLSVLPDIGCCQSPKKTEIFCGINCAVLLHSWQRKEYIGFMPAEPEDLTVWQQWQCLR